MKITTKRLDYMSMKTETKGKEALLKFKLHKARWKIAVTEATEDRVIEPSTYKEASKGVKWRKTSEEFKSGIGMVARSTVRESSL
ncbi:hypothetical protein NL676_038140 [Syzygium grande]|nr:hypothetical protein NL676_038140 [Syzygium grande]